MIRMKVRDIATAKGWNMSQLQKQSGVTMPSIRRYWYGTKDGKAAGEPLRLVDLHVLALIANALHVRVRDLLDDAAA